MRAARLDRAAAGVDGVGMNAPPLARAALGFLAAASAVLVFHQGMWIILYVAGLMPAPPFPVQGVPPFGVPRIISLAFWGGLYGAAYGLALPALPQGPPRWALGLGLGLVATLASWFVVAPLQGQPMGFGFVPSRMLVGLLLNGAWGLGTALILHLLLLRRETA
jgi:hypothetical protein